MKFRTTRYRRPLRRADRYLLREILLPLLVAVVAVAMVVFLFQARRLASAALGLGLRLDDVAVIFVSALPPFLVLAIPIAYLLAVLVGLGRLAQDRELIALRAAGASPWRLARVPIGLGIAVTLVCLPIAMYGEPYGLRMLHRRLVDVGLRNLTRAIQPGVFNEDFVGSAVYAAKRNDDGSLEDVVVFDERNRDRPMLVVSSRGKFTIDAQSIEFSLEDGEMHLGLVGVADRYDRLSFERVVMGVDVSDDLFRKARFVSMLGQMTMQQMHDAAYEAKLSTPLGRRILKQYWRRYAFPSMALVFGLIGAAIALSGGPRTRARNAVLGVLAVLGYYLLTRIADIVVIRYDGLSFVGAWLPNVIAIAVGAWGVHRSGRPR